MIVVRFFTALIIFTLPFAWCDDKEAQIQQLVIKNNEKAAIVTLNRIALSQAIHNAREKHYCYISDLIQDNIISSHYFKEKEGIFSKRGYRFYIGLAGRGMDFVSQQSNSTKKKVRFICYAWPVEYGKTGKKVFVIGVSGSIYIAENQEGKYSSSQKPALNAALQEDWNIYPGKNANDGQKWHSSHTYKEKKEKKEKEKNREKEEKNLPTSEQKAAKKFTYAEAGSIRSIDPLQANMYSKRAITSIYDTLFEYKYLQRPYQLKPCLAKSIPIISSDKLVYEIKLKKNVYFTNHTLFKNRNSKREVTAKDVVYSIKRHFDPNLSSHGNWLWQGRIVGLDKWREDNERTPKTDYTTKIEGLRATDDYTVRIQLTKPYPQILFTFATAFSAIVPHEVATSNYSISKKAIGSGPFTLHSINRNQIVLKKNPSYRHEVLDVNSEGYQKSIHGFTGIEKLNGKKLPLIDEVDIRFISSSENRWQLFAQKNQIQLMMDATNHEDHFLSSKNPIALKEKYAKKYQITSALEASIVFLLFNMENPAFGYHPDKKRNAMNKALRKAIRKAFDWQQRVDQFYSGIGKPFPGVISPLLQDYTPLSNESITKDVAGAKKLLKDAGWTAKNLPTFSYPIVDSVTSQKFYHQVRGFLIEIGYPQEKIEPKLFSYFGDLSRAMKSKKNVMNAYGWGLDYPDAENIMQLFYGANISPGTNVSNFNHEEYNKLFEKATLLPTGEQRKKLYKRMNEILIEEGVGVFGFSRTSLILWDKEIIVYPARDVVNSYFKYIGIGIR